MRGKETKIRIEGDTELILLRPLGVFVRSLIEQIPALSCSTELIDKIELAFSEALTNIYKHAYPTQEKGPLCVEIRVGPDSLEFQFEDHGKTFDPDLTPTPDPNHPRESGLGIWLMRSVMDELVYQSEDGGKNVLRLVKYFSGMKNSGLK